MRRTCLLLVLPLLASCSGGSATSASATPSPTASPTASPTPSPTPSPSAIPTPSVVAVPTPARPAATPFKPVLVLEPDGLGVLVSAASIRHYPFTTTTAGDVSALVDTVRGTGDVQSLPDCGQGARSSYASHGLSLLFDGETWVGWTVQAGTPRLSSVDGVALGLTWTQLKKIRPKAMRSQESLGDEFYESDRAINGFLSGPKDSDTVTTLYAGETCTFR